MAVYLLDDPTIRNAKPGTTIKTLRDGGGLFVLIHPNGSKCFQLRGKLHGKEKLVRLGIYGVNMTLKEARSKAAEVRKFISDGVDPVQLKRVESAKKAADSNATFRTVVDQGLIIKRRTLAPSTYKKITQTFTANVFPRLSTLPITTVDALAGHELYYDQADGRPVIAALAAYFTLPHMRIV